MPSSSFPAADPWLPPVVQPVPVVPPPAGLRPRPLAARVVAGVAAAFASMVVTALDPVPESALAQWVRTTVDRHLDPSSAIVLIGVAMWFVLPRVSYRRRDVLMLLIPIYGLWIIGLAFYRLVALPYRDWRPRPDERGRLAAVEGLPRYYVLTREPPTPAPPSTAAGHRP